jgi:hypothetical protein
MTGTFLGRTPTPAEGAPVERTVEPVQARETVTAMA